MEEVAWLLYSRYDEIEIQAAIKLLTSGISGVKIALISFYIAG